MLVLLLALGPLGTGASPAHAQAEPATAGSEPLEVVVHPPKLQHFVEAVYPTEALDAGQTARVVLELEVDVTGRVVDARVRESATSSFDEAALAAARQFIFSPATRDGTPTAVKILYEYVFEVETRAVPSDYAAIVVDASTGRPVVGATVMLEQGQSRRTLVTDGQGKVEAGELQAGPLSLEVMATGYHKETLTDSLAASERKEVRLPIFPEPTPEDEEVVEIVVRGDRPAKLEVVRRIQKRELERVPGTFGDALRAVRSLPGVAQTPSLSGLLVVRGTSAESTQVFFDGIYTPSVYHFGGLSSVVPTEMLESIDFRPGNFDAKFGRGIGGIVDAQIRSPRNDGQLHALGQVDFIDARAMVETPLGVDGWRVMAGARRSHLDTWLGPLLEGSNTAFTSLPVYYDYQLFLERESLAGDVTRVGFFGADDRVSLLSDSNVFLNEFSQANAFWNIVTEYRANLGTDTKWSHSASFGRIIERVKVGPLESKTYAYPTIFRGELTHRVSDQLTLRMGPDVLFAPFNLRFVVSEEAITGDPLAASPVLEPPRVADTQRAFLQPAGYVALEVGLGDRVHLTPALRVDYTKGTDSWDVSPRLNGTYALVKGFPETTLRAGAGLFREPPEVRFTLPEYGSAELTSIQATQLSLGAEQDLSKQLELSVEGFFSGLDRQLSQGDQNGVTVVNNAGTGRVYGAEFMLRYKADERFFGWATYTLSRSERRYVPQAPRELFPFDQTHIGAILGSYRLGSGWELGGRFRLVSGTPTEPCAQEIWDSSESRFRCIAGGEQQGRAPWFHQLDVRVEKRWRFSQTASVTAYLDVINVYNRETADLPFVPSLGLRGEL